MRNGLPEGLRRAKHAVGRLGRRWYGCSAQSSSTHRTVGPRRLGSRRRRVGSRLGAAVNFATRAARSIAI